MPHQHWNTTLYDRQHQFVWQYGESLIEWLAPQPGEHILDLGCGTGHLTAKLAEKNVIVSGIDADPAMIAVAQQTYPNISFAIADARQFELPAPVDAIFSNAALHWIPEADAVIASVYRALKPGGRFVAEFGGKGNIHAMMTVLFRTLKQLGYPDCDRWNPWYFPSVAEYATCLEQAGFEVTQASLFDRPTPLQDGDAGLRNWFRMFANGILSNIPADQQAQAIEMTEAQLKPVLYKDSGWTADYRRLRVTAKKV
ncbi:MAG TPA: methyltransferase domain-containing protein [Leptolyngbyaceae cyanobacterium M33_DOE_097]|uniref:Class I SAM-dependent methyltransferase n=1 Tax=Oscillatoriales cyanobacterium SpSt-418 TaxID=2282169 RepID=A0A7C3KCK0_9CYAN|nr:methyltransferase domain-containing protein [Leptolyngbyaceae cyanobacterium M33_DOE_097]